ncbi:MAG: hypothetical protein H7Z43_05130, partial [Clostridia bacterium]|nr:hypothetical protein [Deltaproteobacteria bacterium]
MSDVSISNSSLSQQQYILDLQNNGKHKYGEIGDADGDGKPDGDALAGDESGAKGGSSKNALTALAISSAALKSDTTTAVSDAATGASDALSSRGISVGVNGLSSVDDFTGESPNASAALDFSGAPILPEVSSTSAPSTPS